MKRKVVSVILVIAVLTLVCAIASFAKVPPPPVNQTIGIWDGVFNNLTQPECRVCHQPALTNVNAHHLNTNQPVLEGVCYNNLTRDPANTACTSNADCPSAYPTCVGGTDALNPPPVGGIYECLSCHEMAWDPIKYVYYFVPFRDCTLCHDQIAGERSVHHGTTDALINRDCASCHGSLVDNYNDGHYIPTYQPSLVTPWSTTGTGPLGEGGCAFCHSPGTESGKLVYSNAQTHHSTGLSLPPYTGTPSGNCLWCHDTLPHTENDIRTCEQCHGVGSLHNIQVDSNGGGINPGNELAYYGHIGAQADCWGCHGFSSSSAAAPYSGPVIPDVSGLSVYSVTAGNNTTITVTGSALTNVVQGPYGPIELTSNVVLTAANGSTTTLIPSAITQSSMDVTIPSTLVSGNYDLRAVKGPKASNRTSIAVVPPVVISSAKCSSGIVTITGSGFSEYVNAVDSGTSVQILGGSTCTVNSWSNTEIKANCGTCYGTVVVNSIFGTASQQLESPPPPCSYQYSAWSACQPNGTQTRTYTKSPNGCIENPPPVLTQACIYNQPPVAEAGPNKSANRYSTVKFDGSASKDPDGYITKYVWNFGDNSSASGKIVYHKFTAKGTYTVTLTVTDNKGATAKDTATVKVN